MLHILEYILSDTTYCGWFFTIRVVVLCCVTTDAMCTSTQQYKTNKFAASYVYEHSAVLRQPTCCYILHWTNQQTCTYAVLYLKMRNVYQMTWVLSSNDNDGCWHYYQVSSLTYVYTYVYYIICTWYTYISWIRCTRYQRPGTTNHPHHLGADVTFCLPRPQHL